jgi:hypothetical protein
MARSEKFPRLDDLGLGVLLLAPVSVLFLSAITTEALSGRMLQDGFAVARATPHQVVSTPRSTGQTNRVATSARTASANGLIRRSSHE